MFTKLLAILVLLCVKTTSAQISYYDDYYDYDGSVYEEVGESRSVPKPSGVSVMPKTNDTRIPPKNAEFRARVTCTKKMMRLEVDRHLLPLGLGFFEEATHEKHQENIFNPDTTCTRLTRNSTHFIYKVALRCQHAVGELDFGSMTVYSHELLLTNAENDDGRGVNRKMLTLIKQKKHSPLNVFKREIYTIVMECEKHSSASRADSKSHAMNPEYRLYEHRKGSRCSSQKCPHGDICLPNENVDGYFCQCQDCECPVDFYGCSRGKNISERSSSLICIRNDRLCDRRFDCPMQDDELCADVWTPWSMWSSCSQSCGQGTQVRQRSCTNTFTQDPSRCSKKCVLDQAHELEFEERSCETDSCAVVQCMTETMMISLPLEAGMTKERVEKRMHIGSSSDCKPMVNATNVNFIVPLHMCNTSTWVDGDSVFYSNEIIYEVDKPPSAIIVREFGHSYTAKCQYKRRNTVGLRRFELNPGSKLLEVAVLQFRDKAGKLGESYSDLDLIEHYASGDGEFEYQMDIFKDSSFAKPYSSEDYPIQKRLGERMFVAVNFNSQDEDLHVFIEKCWAAAANQEGSMSDSTYTFINNGCPVDPTVNFHNDNNFHFSDRFSIESFKFNDPDHWYVYFHCDVILCDIEENDPACRRECEWGSVDDSLRRKRRDVPDYQRTYGEVVQGPIIFLEENDVASTQFRRKSGITVGTVQHKILTYESERTRDNQEIAEHQPAFWNSPLMSAIIVGLVCLLVGGLLGFTIRRRNTSGTAVANKQTASDLDVDERQRLSDDSSPANV